MSEKLVYLDNNATTQVAPEVIEAMMPFFTEKWGNPSSMHYFGGKVRKHVEHAREQVADFFNVSPQEIVFTSCGTESNNTAIRGVMESYESLQVITTRVEHPAILEPCRYLKKKGASLTELGVDSAGRLNLDELEDVLKKEKAFATIMWANNETGVIFPIEKIAPMVKSYGGIIHTDAVQIAGKHPIDLSKVPVDMLSISGHKIHAPKGVGVLFIRKGISIQPLLLGGHQENGKRGGTENVPYIVGLGVACELAKKFLADEGGRVRKLRDRLEQGILATCPDVKMNGDRENRLPNTSSVSFNYVEGEAILYHMSDAGIAASSGSACASGSLEPSHVIRAMGIPFTAAHGTIRFSLSRYNTEADIDYVLEQLPGIIKKLRAISPYAR
jgi:cysteine desulfurase